MAIFFMFGKYSPESVKGMSSERTERASSIIKKFGGKIFQKVVMPAGWKNAWVDGWMDGCLELLQHVKALNDSL